MPLLFIGRLVVAAVAAFAFSGLYYGLVVGSIWLELLGTPDRPIAPSAWQVLAQLARNIVVAGALAYIFRKARIGGMPDAIGLALVLWLGFQAMAIAGAVIHEHYPVALYAIHTADQLGTMLIMAFCLTVRPSSRQLGANVAGEH